MPLIWFRFSGLILDPERKLSHLMWKCKWLVCCSCEMPEIACVSITSPVEKSQFDNYRLLSAAVKAPFRTNRKQQEAQPWTFFENSIYKMYALTNYPTASWELKSDLLKKQCFYMGLDHVGSLVFNSQQGRIGRFSWKFYKIFLFMYINSLASVITKTQKSKWAFNKSLNVTIP